VLAGRILKGALLALAVLALVLLVLEKVAVGVSQRVASGRAVAVPVGWR
jgi:hypothetical protein